MKNHLKFLIFHSIRNKWRNLRRKLMFADEKDEIKNNKRKKVRIN